MFQAMATGHGGLCTMHADSLESASKRLQQKPMDIPPAYISLMNCALVVKRVKENATGLSSRRVVSVEEIIDASTSYSAFTWNPRKDYFENNLMQSKLLQKIAKHTGSDLNDVLMEHNKRTKILKWMHQHDIRDYKKVSEIIEKYYKDPESLMHKIDYGV